MTILPRSPVAVLLFAAVALPLPIPRPLPAQATIASGSRLSVEAFASRYWLEQRDTEGGRTQVGGFGGRVMAHSGRLLGGDGTIFGRTAIGAFVVATGEQKGIETLHYGVQVDWGVLDLPAGGLLDPFLSLAIGAFRMRSPSILDPLATVTRTDLAATPAVGTYLRLGHSLALRGDLRDVVLFGGETTHNFELQGGVSLGF